VVVGQLDQTAQIEPEVPAEIYGRAADNWRPLLAIADAAAGEWPKRGHEIAIRFGGRRDEQTNGVMLLEDIRRIFDEESIDRVSSQELVTKLVEMEGRPWVEFKNSKLITPTQLAHLLAAFQIVPNNIRIGTKTPKGYKLEQFQDAFARYTGDFAATPPQPSKAADFGPVQAATWSAGVAEKNGRNPAILPLVAAWRLQTPLTCRRGDLDRNAASFAAIPIFRVMPWRPSASIPTPGCTSVAGLSGAPKIQTVAQPERRQAQPGSISTSNAMILCRSASNRQ
jgi:hypothetical protein